MNKRHLLVLAGSLWGVIGLFLIVRGTQMYHLAVNEQKATLIGVGVSVVLSLILGGVKGLLVLSKTARRNRSRIEDLDPPVKIHQVFPKPFYILIPGMMLLGLLLRTWNGLFGGYVVVAAIYCGIGIALITASREYWKEEPAREQT